MLLAVLTFAATVAVATPPPPEPAPEDARFDPVSLQFFSVDKAVKSAVDALRADRGTEALGLLPEKATDVRVRFLRALALLAAGKHSDAASAFELLAPDYPLLAGRCHCLAAAAFEKASDKASQARHLAGCAADPSRGNGAILDRARVLVELGLATVALEELPALFTIVGTRRSEAIFVAAQAEEKLGRGKEALAHYRTIFVDDPLNPFADRARERAKALVASLKAPPLPVSRQLDRIEKLIEGGGIKSAVRALAELPQERLCDGEACVVPACDASADFPPSPPWPGRPNVVVEPVDAAKATDPENDLPVVPACFTALPQKPAGDEACRILVLRAAVARKTRANTPALSMAREVLQRCADRSIRSRAFAVAQGAAQALRLKDAVALAVAMSNAHADATASDDALLGASTLLRDSGDGKGERALLRMLIRAHPDGDQRGEALFRLFWSHRAEGHPAMGLSALAVLMADYDAGPRSDGGDAEKARYWWGRTLAISGKDADVRGKGAESLMELARTRPATYYGLLAAGALANLVPPLQAAPTTVAPLAGELRLSALVRDPAYQQALELWRLGLLQRAREMLSFVAFAQLRTDGRRGQEGALVVAELLQRLGEDRAAHAVARRELLRYMRDLTDPFARRALAAAYPLAFRSFILKHCAVAGFDANFLQGLMREESALDPLARSPVGARGLSQVMPATARQVARSLKIKDFRTDQLWDPDTNLRIGSTYLGSMLRQFGHPGLAAASYNAGPGAVSRWLANSTTDAFDAFVEDIPFAETKGYVRRVLRSYAVYTLLSGAHSPPVSLSVRPRPLPVR